MILTLTRIGLIYNVFWSYTISATTFAGVGAQNAIILAAGNRLNVSIGNATAGIKFPAVVTGNRFNVATGSVSVVSWHDVDPNATGVWTPIDPLNP